MPKLRLLAGGRPPRSSTCAGLVDEMEIHVVPLLLGGGERLFDDLGKALHAYECVELVSSPVVAHHRYVRRDGA